MFVATNRIRVRKPHGPDLEELFQQRGGLEKQAGFVEFQLWKSQSEADHEEYLVVSHWETKDAHDQWTQSEAFRLAHTGLRSDYIMGRGEFSAYDLRISSQAGD